MMMQEKLMVSNRQATWFMTNYFPHVESVGLENFAVIVLFCPENLFYKKFFFYRQFLPFCSSSFEEYF